jgi:hypothetical protein
MVSIWQQDPSTEDDLPGYLDGPPRPADREHVHPRDLVAGTRKVVAAAVSVAVVIATPQEAGRPLWTVTAGVPHRAGVPVRQTTGTSAIFLRMVRLPGRRLGELLDGWWATRAGPITLSRRLRVRSLVGDPAAGWMLRGELRRLTRWHWVPVEIELFPMGNDFAWMTMTPRTRVLVSSRYFRTGHAVLDQLTAELARAA